MHGCTDGTDMAKSGRSDGQQTASGCPQRRDACVTVAACSAQHGGRMAGPSEPAADKTSSRAMATDVGGVRAAGGTERAHSGAACGALGVAQVGGLAGNSDAPIHPQAVSRIGTPVSAPGVLALLESQRYRCALSGRELAPHTAALDHIVPVRVGGQHVIENAQVLDKDVNRAKNSLTSDEFIALCREVVRWSDGAGCAKNGNENAPKHPPSLQGSAELASDPTGGDGGTRPSGTRRGPTWADPWPNGRAGNGRIQPDFSAGSTGFQPLQPRVRRGMNGFVDAARSKA